MVEEIGELAEDSDWTFDQRQAAERFIVDYERESIGKDWDDPAPHGGQRAKALRKPEMVIEWFDEVADSALSEPVDPLIQDLLDEGALSVFYGDTSSGKTFAALDMGFHVSAGLEWNGKKVKRGLVVYVAAEGGKRIKRRLAALKKRYRREHGIGAPKPLFALIRYSMDLRSNEADLNQLLALVRAAEQETGEVRLAYC